MNRGPLSSLLFMICMLATAPAVAVQTVPDRVVSINLCTDQLLLMLADDHQIASVSYLAISPEHSFAADQAAKYKLNHGRLEEIVALDPDLVLASEYTDPRLLTQLAAFDIKVESFSMSTELTEIDLDIQRMGALLGQHERAAEIQASFHEALESHERVKHHTQSALFFQPRGYTSGNSTLQNAALKHAGWLNLAAQLGIQGYAPIDLETLVMSNPDQIFTSHQSSGYSRASEMVHHPVLDKMTRHRPVIEIPYKYWICAGPMIVEAIDMLANAHAR